MQRLSFLCNPDAGHPWQAEGYSFVLSAAMGDLKWQCQHYGIHNYRANRPCSLCRAAKCAPAVEDTICDFRPTARHLASEITHEQYVASLDPADVPVPMQFIRLERFLPDLMHAGLLGTGKCLNGSALVYLIEEGCFNGFERGIYEEVLAEKLRAAYKSFKDWTKANRLRVVQPRFTCARIHRKSRQFFPCLSSKAVVGKTISYWICHVAETWAARPDASEIDRMVHVCVYSYCAMLDLLSTAPLVLTAEQAQTAYDHGMLHLQTYAYLRQASTAIRRGNGKNLWLMLPKQHHIQHMLRRMHLERVSPNWYSLLTAESFVGLIGKLTRKLGSCIYSFDAVYTNIKL